MTLTHPSLARLSEQQAADFGEKTAITFDGVDYSFSQMHMRTLNRAAALHMHGINHGDRVAYLGPNHPAFIELLLACLRIGAIFVPLNWRLSPAELDYQLENAEVSLLVVGPELYETAARLTTGTPVETVDWDPTVVTKGSAVQVPAVGIAGDEPAFLLYTSGTTGRPKGAVLSHANILWNAFSVLLTSELDSSDSTLVAAPMFHVAALDLQVMTSYIRGASIVIEPGWDVDVVFDHIETHRLTWLFGVTTMFADLVASPRWAGADLSSVRWVNSGGAPIPIALIHDYQGNGDRVLPGLRAH